MSPEQLRGDPVDHRADIFAFGVTAYELLTNCKPFPGETPQEILKRQMQRGSEFVHPLELNPDMPPDLDRLILKCLQADPDKRYLFMGVVTHELKTILYV
jgi:serine/threonine-protein kinase